MERSFSTVEDIIADEGFQGWYSGADAAAAREWESRVAGDPELAMLVKEAKDYMQSLSVQEMPVPEGQVRAAEQRLMTALQEVGASAPVVRMKRSAARWWWAAAAVMVIAVGSVLFLNSSSTKPTSLQTTYGEIREQQLPDGSKVMLNANSEISYQEGATREVWLKGEAFFHVAKTASKARFIVHADKFDVVVTGTQFNVVNREGKTNVMLTEGSVTLRMLDGKELNMKPGDFVEINAQQPELKTAREEAVLAWKDKKLNFENTPLSIAVRNIEDLYGIKIRLADKKLGDKVLTGIIENDNLEVLLDALEVATGFHVVQNGNEVLITE